MGGPNSINLSNPIHGGGYNPRPTGAQQAPNLKELALTIDDFRQFASGKYNAGAAPGGRIGAHRAWARLESANIDPSEASAIRLAFAFALEDAGVSGAKMAAACKRLGLEADFSFSENDAKVYTALTREEVHDVIEQSLGGRSGKERAEPLQPNKGKLRIIEEKPELLIEKDEEKDEIIIKEDDDNNIINNDKSINDDDDEIELVDQKDGKFVAQHNFDKLVDLLYSDYSAQPIPLTKAEVRSIIQRIDNWEEKLSKCKMDNTATRLGNMNRDLINFITQNMKVIQKGIDEAIANKRKK